MVDQLLREIVDTQEKLDVVVCLHSGGGVPRSPTTITSAVGHPWLAVLEALSALHRDGVVTPIDADRTAWQIDPFSGWQPVIELLAVLHTADRIGLLRRITALTLERLRTEPGAELGNVVVLTPRL